jgi:PleD family two-component response regulator
MKTHKGNGGIKILVVEDSRTQAEYLRHILEKEGYPVALAVNGIDALEQIKIGRPTIVLTDILMPEMDGYELCRAIKKDKNLSDIPVILVTQLFDPADMIKGLEAGADNIIIKPFEPDHVMFRINSTLQTLGHSSSDDTGASPEMPCDDPAHPVPASQVRTPTILLTSYDLAIRKNAELQEANGHLTIVNEDLQRANENLLQENTERRRTEESLAKEIKKLQMMDGLTRDNLINQLTAMQKCLELANTFREKDSAISWEHITKAELLVDQALKGLR